MSGLVRAEALFRARRRDRRRRTAGPLLAAALVTTVLGGAVWVGYYSPVLELTSVSVKGTSRLSIEQVLTAADVRRGGSLLSVPVGTIGARVRALAPVADVRVARRWPHTLEIDVTERTPVAAVASGGGADADVVLLDARGVAFATVPTAPAGLLDLRVPAPALGRPDAQAVAALSVWSGLPSAVRHQVSWIDATSPDDVALHLARGATVIWGSAGDGADKLAVLAALLRHPASTYDVSTPSIAVTR